MTDSEIYAACKDYSSLRAKPGCASNKSYWVIDSSEVAKFLNTSRQKLYP